MYQRPVIPAQTAGAASAVGALASAGAGRGGPVVSMIEVSLQRLEEIVDQETAALKARKAINLKDFNDRKSQALLELTRMLRTVQGAEGGPDVAKRVGSLKAKLVINQQALKVHLEAVREISTTLSDAIRHADSDGTYTQAISVSRQP